ncbi:MAG: hypothetical protein HRU81_13900 [Gammaproteobacteria bacterium]|nr:MAG: hypothetical protein HRU81_13900 [Gammaproteobacteria bacterium]
MARPTFSQPSRRSLLLAIAGVAVALAGRRLGSPRNADPLALLAARVAQLAGPLPAVTARGAEAAAGLPELLRDILGGTRVVQLAATNHWSDDELRQRIQRTIRGDFARRAIGLHGGWLLSRAELALLALLARAG